MKFLNPKLSGFRCGYVMVLCWLNGLLLPFVFADAVVKDAGNIPAATNEVTSLIRALQDMEAAAVSQQQADQKKKGSTENSNRTIGPEPEASSATLIGENRLPDVIINEFDIGSGGTLGAVLRSLAVLGDVNLVFSDAVDKQPSINFKMSKPTPWNELFESILKVHHLTYLQDANIIRIMSVDDLAREYELQESISRRATLAAEKRLVEPLVLAVVKVKYVKVEKLVEVLKELMGHSTVESAEVSLKMAQRGSVCADVINNAVIIHAIQSDVDKLINLIQKMDQPTEQVRIEANIVEINTEVVRELGMKWQAETKFRDYNETTPTVSRNVPSGYGILDETFGKMSGSMDPLTGIIQYGILTKDFNLAATLTALEEDGRVKILSRPSITTMNNMKALIKSGAEVPFSTTDRYGDQVVEWREAVLQLEVTPHIIDDEELTLDIHILNNEVDFSQTVDGNPVIKKKEANSYLMLRDGETTVIAGLSKNNLEDTASGIPLLKDIPYLGKLFTSKHKSDKNQEMMIFITPRIVSPTLGDESDWVKQWMESTYNR